MKKLLNVLYVTTQGCYLRKEGETVAVEREGTTVLRLPIHTLAGIVTFGNVMVSPGLLGLCAERGVCVTMLSEYGRFLARVEGPISGNVHLRLAQMRAHENATRKGELARNFVIGKILNARTVLLRRIRDHGEDKDIRRAEQELACVVRNLQKTTDAAQVRGFEGEAAATYFAVFNKLLVAQESEFAIAGRNRRPPLDPMNALLSFFYTLLTADCRGALEGVGLDPQIGFLHEIRPGRPSLALYLMEEFRAVIADRMAVSLVNLRQVQPKDFVRSESGAVLLRDEPRKTVLTAWQKKKQELLIHPFLGEKVAIGLLPHVQALLLARYLRGDIDNYPPYVVR